MAKQKYSFWIDGSVKESLDARAAIAKRPASSIVRELIATGLGHPCTGLEEITVDQD